MGTSKAEAETEATYVREFQREGQWDEEGSSASVRNCANFAAEGVTVVLKDVVGLTCTL